MFVQYLSWLQGNEISFFLWCNFLIKPFIMFIQNKISVFIAGVFPFLVHFFSNQIVYLFCSINVVVGVAFSLCYNLFKYYSIYIFCWYQYYSIIFVGFFSPLFFLMEDLEVVVVDFYFGTTLSSYHFLYFSVFMV